jgi:capsular polysaccharide transport system permease protein
LPIQDSRKCLSRRDANWISVGARVVSAVVRQDMRTRFGRNYFSYVVAIGWPLTHAIFLIGAYWLVNRVAPVGDDPAVFIATGVVPYILCLYPSRSMPMLYLYNRQLLGLPAIKPIHLICAGLVVELLTAAIVAILIYLCLALGGVDIAPIDLGEAALALAATIFLAIGLGVFNVVMAALMGPFYLVFYIVMMIAVYISAGVLVPIWLVPEPMRTYLRYNPMLNLVEWSRSAYYSSFDPDLINKSLVLGTATCLLFIGLLGERFLRNKFYAI